ncbi:zinc ABC transporter substrate-binding protein [bacterium]|nr:zinc ABC transporter substrate-binding protein [bacterium]
MIKYLQFLIVLLITLLLSSCNSQKSEQSVSSDKIYIFVSIPPQSAIVKRIGGEHVSVDILVKPGASPHTFEPTPTQMIDIGKAKIFFSIGLPFEKSLIDRIRKSNKQLVFTAMDKGINKREIGRHHHEHSENTHSEDNLDPHIWLAPDNIRIMARNTAEMLAKYDNAHADDYRKNLIDFLLDVDSVDIKISDILAPFKGYHFYVFHPSFGYFADAYGFHQEAVEIEGKSPSIKQLNELVTKAKSENVRIIFVQPQFDAKSAESIAEIIDGAVIPLDPLKKDVLGNLEEIANQLKKAFRSNL